MLSHNDNPIFKTVLCWPLVNKCKGVSGQNIRSKPQNKHQTMQAIRLISDRNRYLNFYIKLSYKDSYVMNYLIWVSISIGNRPIDSHLHDDVNAPNTLEYSTPIVNMSWNYPCVKVDFSFNKGTEWILGASLQNMKS